MAESIGDLYNLRLAMRVDYVEDISEEGTSISPTWRCFIRVRQVTPPLKNAAGQVFWDLATTRAEARRNAASHALYAIGYYKVGDKISTLECPLVLHDLRQAGRIKYSDKMEHHGPDYDPTWSFSIHVESVNGFLPDAEGQVFWSSAKTKTNARRTAARQVLSAIGYYDPPVVKIPVPALDIIDDSGLP